MAKDLGIKAFLLSITSLILTSLTTAAPGGISGSWSLFGDLGTTLVNTGQAITWYEISTAPDLAFFIAIWIATGAITLKFIDLIWSVMTQRINLGSGSKYSVSHDSGSGTLEKIIAGALSFIGAQYIGMLIGPILGSAMLLLGAMLAITIAIIFYWFLIASGGSLFGGSSSGGGSGGFNVDVHMDIGGSTGDDASEAGGAESDADAHEDKAKDELDAAEDDASSGETGKADEEAEAAAEDIQEAIKDMNIAATDIEDMLQVEHKELEQTLSELSQTLGIEEDEEGIIEHIKSGLDDSEDIVQNDILPRLEAGEIDAGHPQTILGGVDGAERGLSHVASDVQEISVDVKNLREEVTEEKGEVEEEIKEMLSEIQQLAAAHQLIQKLRQEDKIGYELDEELEAFAKSLNDEDLYEEGEYEEREEDELREKIRTMMSQEAEIEKTLQKADQILSKIDQMDIQEDKEIRSEIEEIEHLESSLNEIVSTLGKQGTPLPNEVNEKMANIVDYIEDLESNLQQIDSWKREEDEEIKTALSNVKSALQEVEG